jgi:peptidoglycan/LPS O-acetylase OafA/YrhL
LNTAPPSLGAVLAAYTFLPWARPDGLVQPVYSLGWTLNYEMFFYAVFALFLGLPRPRAVAAVALALGAAVLAGWLLRPASVALAFWTNPIMLQFAAGMGLALLGVSLPGAARLVLAVAGLALLVLAPEEWHRGLRFAPGAVLLVAAAALGPEPRLGPRTAAWMARLGDASYALYLVHPFALRGVALAYAALGLPAALAAALAVTLAVAVALASHRWFEAPLTRRLAGG